MKFPIKLTSLILVSLVTRLGGVSAAPAIDLPEALGALAAAPGSELRIPPGRYFLPKGGLSLDKVKNVTIQATGVTFVATDLSSSALRFTRCEGVSVVGLVIDYDPLPFTQGTVTAVDAQAKTADFQVHAGYPGLGDEYLVEKQLHLFAKDSPRWKLGVPDYYPKKIERISLTTGRLHFSSAAKGTESVQPGDRIVLTIRKKAGIHIGEGCKGMRFENVTLHAAPGIGILVRFAEETGTFVNTRVSPGPRPVGAVEDRLLSTSADAFNAAYTRKGPLIDDCEFSYMGDDSINLHGVMLPVLKWLNDRTFLSMRPNRGEPFDRLIHAGDEVRFLTEPNYSIASVGRVRGITRSSQNPADWEKAAKEIWPTFRDSTSAVFYEISLDEPVQERIAGSGVFCEVPATNAPGFVIRNSYFHDHRARGLRLMACDGLVENNRMERLKGAAITVGGEFAFWREAGWCRNVMIRGNQIKDVGEGENMLLPGNYTPGAISIMARVTPQGPETRYFQGNENITIQGNVIDGCPLSGIHIVAASGVKILDNVLRRTGLKDAPHAGGEYGLSADKPVMVIQAEAQMADNEIVP